MTFKDIKLNEFYAKDLVAQLENLIQAEKQYKEKAQYKELYHKIIKGLEVFQKEFPFEIIIVVACPEIDQEIEIYFKDIISQMKDNWLR